jgi:hypothetical protein
LYAAQVYPYNASREEFVSHVSWTHRTTIAFALSLGLALACADQGPSPIDDSPLAGLKTAQTNDSAGNPAPPPPVNLTPGSLRGTVRIATENPQGPDTLHVGVVEGAIVSVYPRVVAGPDTTDVGPIAAQVLTDAEGRYQFGTLPGGEYVITFNPPASLAATYGGVWTIATVHEHSNDHPWWITLWKK